MILLGVVPRLDQSVAHRVRSSLEGAEVIEIEAGAGKGVLHMVYNGSLNRFFI